MNLSLKIIIESIDTLIGTAKGVVASEMGVIEGARVLSSLMNKVSSNDTDPDFMIFVRITSEAEHIPLGASRDDWSKASLKKSDIEKKAIEKRYRSRAIHACAQLLQRYHNPPIPKKPEPE